MSEPKIPGEDPRICTDAPPAPSKTLRAEELKALCDGLERILLLRFPAHDAWGAGRISWEKERSAAVEAITQAIAREQPE